MSTLNDPIVLPDPDEFIGALNLLVADCCRRIMLVKAMPLCADVLSEIIKNVFINIIVSEANDQLIAICGNMQYHNSVMCEEYEVCWCKSKLAKIGWSKCHHLHTPISCNHNIKLRNMVGFNIKRTTPHEFSVQHYILVDNIVYTHTYYKNTKTRIFNGCDHQFITNKVINITGRDKLMILRFDGEFKWM